MCDFLYDGKSGKTFKNVNKHFHNFIGQNQQKTKSENGMKSSLVPKIIHDISIPQIIVLTLVHFELQGALVLGLFVVEIVVVAA